MTFNFYEIFNSSPIIYLVLFTLFVAVNFIWMINFFSLKKSVFSSKNFLERLKDQVSQKNFEAALLTCEKEPHFSSRIVACALATRQHGPDLMREAMIAEGKRCTLQLKQRHVILKKIALLSLLVGLMGSLFILFYAFYEVNRSHESLVTTLSQLKLALGPFSCGLFIALWSSLLRLTLKKNVSRFLEELEGEALSFGSLIDPLVNT